MQAVARVAVTGVERQLGSGEGPAKYDAAANAVQDAAAHLGLSISDDLASALIHAALAEVEKVDQLSTDTVNSAISQAYQTGFTDALTNSTQPEGA